MRRFWCGMMCVLVAALVGCSTDEPDRKVDEPVVEAPKEAPPVEEPKVVEPPPKVVQKVKVPVGLEGAPTDEEYQTFELVWQGPAGELELRASAEEGAEVSGRRKMKKGEKLKWTSSRMEVHEPRAVKARVATTLPGATPHDAPGGSPVELAVPAGGEVEIFKYAGEGTCIVGVDGALYDAGCPQPEAFEAEGWDGRSEPTRFTWWVQLGGKVAGWARVDGTRLVGKPVRHGVGD